jgi:zinc protease
MYSKLKLFVSTVLLMPIIASAQTAPGAAPAQPQPESVKQVEIKGKVPVNPQTLRVQLPRPEEGVFSNGLRVYLLEDHKLPTFNLQFVIKGGGLADPPEKRGVAMITSSLLREGTKQRTSRDIAEQLAALGASLGAGASPSSGESSVTVSGLSEHLDATLAIAADVVRNPVFPQTELDKYRTRFASQLQYQRSLPSFIAQERFMSAVYRDHPGSLIVPPDPVIAALSSADLAEYHRKFYKPNNMFVVAHGDISLKDLVAKLERAFGTWEKGEIPAAKPAELIPPDAARVFVIDRPGSVQTSLRIGSLGIARKSEDYFAMVVMNHILGGGPASRLFTNLREDKGYTYGVSSTFSGSSFPGVVFATTDVRTEVTKDAMRELTKELKRIAEEPVSKQELDNAQRALVGRFALSLDSPQSLIGNLVTQKIYGFPDDYWDTYPQHIEAVTPKDIQRVASKYFAADRLQIVAVGDAKSMGDALQEYGSAESSPTKPPP